jgi:hypothetical protein
MRISESCGRLPAYPSSARPRFYCKEKSRRKSGSIILQRSVPRKSVLFPRNRREQRVRYFFFTKKTPATSAITKSTRKIKNRICEMLEAPLAISVKPRRAATIATIKNMKAQRSIVSCFYYNTKGEFGASMAICAASTKSGFTMI